MKKLSLFVAGISVLAGLTVQAANTNVTSVNIVGYIKADLPSNQFVFAAVNMNAVGGTNQVFGPSVGDQLPVGTAAYFWNVASQKWDKVSKAAASKGGWGATSNRLVAVGEAMFLNCPTNASINLLGEVPLQATSLVTLASGYNALGYMYPVDIAWTSTALSVGLPVGSALNIWNVTSQKWDKVSKAAVSKGGWGAATNIVLKAGQAFFVQNTTYTNLFEPRPFTP